ncbi:hypothetical protein R1flu_010206 [Riccia fluitans]|uniref:Uncharacterized protein n=1 Tax=Riccia fluitans TaxID=41844 RepID=A0ABD1Z6U5_9MARC
MVGNPGAEPKSQGVAKVLGRMMVGAGIAVAGVSIGTGIALGLYFVGRGIERHGIHHASADAETFTTETRSTTTDAP